MPGLLGWGLSSGPSCPHLPPLLMRKASPAWGHSHCDPQGLACWAQEGPRSSSPTPPSTLARAAGAQESLPAPSPHLELAEGVAAVQVLVLAVHLQRVVLRLLHQRLPEHRGLLSEGAGHQCQGHILGGHLEGEALLGGGGRVSRPHLQGAHGAQGRTRGGGRCVWPICMY